MSYHRASQVNNPEVLLCSLSTNYWRQISQLRQITRDLNIITGNQVCSQDDEDCSVDLTVCDLQIPTPFRPNVEVGSATDNGAPSVCSTCDDPCREVISSSTTISIVAPTRTVRPSSSRTYPPASNPGVVIEPTSTPVSRTPSGGCRSLSLLAPVVLLLSLSLAAWLQLG